MTAAEAIDALRYHAHSQTCTLTPDQCAELVAALTLEIDRLNDEVADSQAQRVPVHPIPWDGE